MIPIYIAYTLLMSLLVFLMFYSTLGKFLKATALSLSLVLGLLVQAHYQDQLGKPIPTYPTGEFLYVHHETQGDSIKLWAWSEEEGDRLYIFPYSQETAQKLAEAQDKAEEGVEQSGEFSGDDGDESSPGLRVDDWEAPDNIGDLK